MLLSENFRRRHQCDLIPILDRDDGGFESDDSFPRADIALQQAAHGRRFFHIGGDFLQHPLLRARGMERENFLDGGAGAIVQLKSNSGLRLLFATFQLETKLHKKQLFEDETEVSRRARG